MNDRLHENILRKKYHSKHFELMNAEYQCYEFLHFYGEDKVRIMSRKCSDENPYGDKKGWVWVSVKTANAFFKKLMNDSTNYKWNWA